MSSSSASSASAAAVENVSVEATRNWFKSANINEYKNKLPQLVLGKNNVVTLTSNEVFDDISVILAWKSTVGWKKRGNVCVAFCHHENTNYFAFNSLGNEADESHLLESQQRFEPYSFLFDCDADSRLKLLTHKDGNTFWNAYKSYFKEKNVGDYRTKAFAAELCRNLEKSAPQLTEVPSEDGLLSAFLELCNQARNCENNRLKQAPSDFEKITAFVELLFIYCASGKSMVTNAFESLMGTDNFFNSLIRVSLMIVMKNECSTSQNKEKLTQAEKREEDKLLRKFNKWKRSNKTLVEKLESMVPELAKFATQENKLVSLQPNNNEENHVLHCEVKLFLHLKENGIVTKDVRMYISKPLCIDCFSYFFCAVDDSERPLFHQMCFNHYPKVYCSVSCGDLSRLYLPARVNCGLCCIQPNQQTNQIQQQNQQQIQQQIPQQKQKQKQNKQQSKNKSEK
jgi:hypothetical protein